MAEDLARDIGQRIVDFMLAPKSGRGLLRVRLSDGRRFDINVTSVTVGPEAIDFDFSPAKHPKQNRFPRYVQETLFS